MLNEQSTVFELERRAIAGEEEFERALNSIPPGLGLEEERAILDPIESHFGWASEDALHDLMSAPPATFEDLLAKARFYYRRGGGSHLLEAAADFMDALCTVAIGHEVRLHRPTAPGRVCGQAQPDGDTAA